MKKNIENSQVLRAGFECTVRFLYFDIFPDINLHYLIFFKLLEAAQHYTVTLRKWCGQWGCKQLALYASSRHKPLWAFIWCHVSVNGMFFSTNSRRNYLAMQSLKVLAMFLQLIANFVWCWAGGVWWVYQRFIWPKTAACSWKQCWWEWWDWTKTEVVARKPKQWAWQMPKCCVKCRGVVWLSVGLTLWVASFTLYTVISSFVI